MQRLEIHASTRFLEQVLVRRPVAFAYPFGGADDLDHESTRLVIENGYEAAFMAVTGAGTSTRDPFHIARHVVPDLDGEGFSRWLEPAATGKGEPSTDDRVAVASGR